MLTQFQDYFKKAFDKISEEINRISLERDTYRSNYEEMNQKLKEVDKQNQILKINLIEWE